MGSAVFCEAVESGLLLSIPGEVGSSEKEKREFEDLVGSRPFTIVVSPSWSMFLFWEDRELSSKGCARNERGFVEAGMGAVPEEGRVTPPAGVSAEVRGKVWSSWVSEAKEVEEGGEEDIVWVDRKGSWHVLPRLGQ